MFLPQPLPEMGQGSGVWRETGYSESGHSEQLSREKRRRVKETGQRNEETWKAKCCTSMDGTFTNTIVKDTGATRFSVARAD